MKTKNNINQLRFMALLFTALFTLQSASAETARRLELFSNGEDEAPIVFEATADAEVAGTWDGYTMFGEVNMITPLGTIPLLGANLAFTFAPGTQRIETVRGMAYVPSPFVSDSVEITKPAIAEFGLDFGENLASLGVPLQPERKYLFFRFQTGLEMAIGTGGDEEDTKAFTLKVPAGGEAMLLLDPLDPFYYFSGAIVSPEGVKKDGEGGDTDASNTDSSVHDGGASEDGSASDDSGSSNNESGPVSNVKSDDGDSDSNSDADSHDDSDDDGNDEEDGPNGALGEGRSYHGYIPYIPRTTVGIEDKATGFTGYKILSGTFPLGELPIEVSGYEIVGVTLPEGLEHLGMLAVDFGLIDRIGVNGELSVSFSFLRAGKLGKIASLDFHLGDASGVLEVRDEKQHAYFSGVIEPDTSWIPEFIPIVPSTQLITYGYLGPDTFRLHASGRYAVDLRLIDETGLDVSNLVSIEGTLHVDNNGFLLEGIAGTGFGPIGYSSERRVTVYVPFDEDGHPYIEQAGTLDTPGITLEGVGRASDEGLAVTGQITGVDFDWMLAGLMGVDETGPFYRGATTVPQPLNDLANAEVVAAAEKAKQDVQDEWDALEAATKDYEFELSLRGMRSAIPAIVDTIIDKIDDEIDDEFDDWPRYVPGKSAAKRAARDKAAPYKDRLRTLKSRVRQGDSTTTRAALRAALLDVIRNQRLKIKVAVLGTIVDRDFISGSTESKLRKALAGVDAIPEASNVKVRAQEAWDRAPKREVLNAVAEGIEQGTAAAPRILSLSFDRPLYGTPTMRAVVQVNGETRTYEVDYDRSNPLNLGKVIGKAMADVL